MSRTDADEEFLHKYDVDRRSVFVGNLPLDTTKEELMDLFAPMCDVVDANVVARPNYYG
jgi:RNA recognition motif-containing protein